MSILHTNFHVETQEQRPEFNILYVVSLGFYVYKTAFASLEIIFLTIPQTNQIIECIDYSILSGKLFR